MDKNLPGTLRRAADFLEDLLKKLHSETIRWTPWYIQAIREAAAELEEYRRVFNADSSLKMTAQYLGTTPERLRWLGKKPNGNCWVRPQDGLPESGDGVLALVNGSPCENVALHQAYQMAHYYEGDGWVVDEWPEWEEAEILWWAPLPDAPESEAA